MASFPENRSDRKKDHIELAFKSQTGIPDLDARFYYEPVLSKHPSENQIQAIAFGNKTLSYPIWVSSMTGGTAQAKKINENLALACREFGLGMGLGSCRKLIEHPELLPDFDMRELIGNDLPLYINLGIAQIEQWFMQSKQELIKKLVDMLRADGLIIHVNPLQEFMQAEGDRFKNPPIDTIKKVLDQFSFPVIVKEVGQGMGPESLKALLQLPLQAIEFGAFGGTNFALLELNRKEGSPSLLAGLAQIGHSAEEMMHYCNALAANEVIACKQLIVSGGVRDYLDGYYYISKSKIPALYGQASGFLKYAQGSYEDLRYYIQQQIRGLNLAFSFLKVK